MFQYYDTVYNGKTVFSDVIVLVMKLSVNSGVTVCLKWCDCVFSVTVCFLWLNCVFSMVGLFTMVRVRYVFSMV